MVNDTNDNKFVTDTENGLSLTDFWAPWCAPCKMQSPIIEELAENSSVSSKVNFYKMNVDDNPDTAKEFGIMSIPTLLVKKDGKVVDQIVGLHSKEQLEEMLSEY
ncbi:thioredoxin [Lactobacillus sp. S2-2]|uniref:thioredoxin n=1 Tax=Lactobacillus sp. S2-2 TaxID=2692917 RepID=UPI001F009C70|nr:thioredoxin [Lactobacillus sp. S2-2]MCF6515818.1 thioredoxin [Lactobacillus sp. S2-2]